MCNPGLGRGTSPLPNSMAKLRQSKSNFPLKILNFYLYGIFCKDGAFLKKIKKNSLASVEKLANESPLCVDLESSAHEPMKKPNSLFLLSSIFCLCFGVIFCKSMFLVVMGRGPQPKHLVDL